MGEENIKRLYATIARIISEREGVKVTITVKRIDTDCELNKKTA
jgi:hypothetical protein